MSASFWFYHGVFVASVLWPAMMICRRAGIKPSWALTLLVPVFGLVAYSCALAFQRWPAVAQDETP